VADWTVVDNPKAGRLEVTVDGQTAFAEYRVLETGIMFPHTETPVALEGRGIGGALVKAGMRMARERGVKVIPTCTFFAGYIARHPEFHDLVHEGYRKALGID
jgi:predicted GNAT family acetyltransferase